MKTNKNVFLQFRLKSNVTVEGEDYSFMWTKVEFHTIYKLKSNVAAIGLKKCWKQDYNCNV
jgi:hypothetical protein